MKKKVTLDEFKEMVKELAIGEINRFKDMNNDVESIPANVNLGIIDFD